MLTKEKRDFITFMLRADVLRFGDFITKSGRKTPYFVNTGNYRTGLQSSRLGEFYAGMIHETIGDGFDALFGPAYKGIPLVTSTAGALARLYETDKPFFFNRKEEKDHGEGGTLVGYQPKDGDRIIIIEDVITSGAALRETMPVLQRAADLKATDMFISVDRCERGGHSTCSAVQEAAEEFGISVHALVTVLDVRAYLEEEGTDPALLKRMDDYLSEYCAL